MSQHPDPGSLLDPADVDPDLVGALRGAPGPDAGRLAALRERLGAAAAAQGAATVSFERHDTPIGRVLVAATGTGLVRLALPVEAEDEVLDDLAARVSARTLAGARSSTTAARRQLDAYFAGRLRIFDVPLDHRLTTGFRRRVLAATARIPFGSTATYREVATAAGSAGAVRAAGTALATNPLPIVVPCHRVLRTGGGTGGYRGGVEAKAALLELERRAT